MRDFVMSGLIIHALIVVGIASVIFAGAIYLTVKNNKKIKLEKHA